MWRVSAGESAMSLSTRCSEGFGRGRGRGRGRGGRRGRRGDYNDDEDDGSMTLEEYEAMKKSKAAAGDQALRMQALHVAVYDTSCPPALTWGTHRSGQRASLL